MVVDDDRWLGREEERVSFGSVTFFREREEKMKTESGDEGEMVRGNGVSKIHVRFSLFLSAFFVCFLLSWFVLPFSIYRGRGSSCLCLLC